jgi:hypothetical protein
MELDPITADFPSRTAREEDEEAAERATGGGLAPEAVAMVREIDGFDGGRAAILSERKKSFFLARAHLSLRLSLFSLPNSNLTKNSGRPRFSRRPKDE